MVLAAKAVKEGEAELSSRLGIQVLVGQDFSSWVVSEHRSSWAYVDFADWQMGRGFDMLDLGANAENTASTSINTRF